MTLKVRYISLGLVLAAIIAIAFGVFYTVRANPSFFIEGNATAVATSTLTFITPGLATTTLTQQAYVAGNPTGINAATLLVQLTGSSTLSIINIAFEYADATSGTNCQTTPASCDWYRDSLIGSETGIISTSTNTINASQTNSYSLTFASTSPGGAGGANSRTTRILNVQTPSQYVRAIITVPIGALNSAVWAKWLPVKQNP